MTMFCSSSRTGDDNKSSVICQHRRRVVRGGSGELCSSSSSNSRLNPRRNTTATTMPRHIGLSLITLVVALLICNAPTAQCQQQQQQQPLPPLMPSSSPLLPLLTPTAAAGHAPEAAAGAGGSSSAAAAAAAASPASANAGPQPSCENVRSLLELRGVSQATAVAAVSTADDSNGMLHFCEFPAKGACCENSMERKLATLSRLQLEKNTRESISKLASVLGTRATKFNAFFKQLLSDSRREFHEMFKRTYGVIYEQNAYVFSNMFNELERYFTSGNVDLAGELDSFFNVLYQKMFSVINAQYRFDDKYLDCVSEHMKELKPFGDVPDKLSVQIKRSFVATRTYEQALSAAAEVARQLIALRPSSECTAALTRMQQCGLCRGYTQKPCSTYCVNVMRGCLHYYSELDAEWDNFVASMEKVSERLLGPFNIVMVVEPMNIKVSEAIMNFQDTGDEITKQVFQGCGKPQLDHRQRRAVSPRFAAEDQLEEEEVMRSADEFAREESFGFVEEAGEQESQRRERRAADPGSRELKFEPLKFASLDSADSGETEPKRGSLAGRRKTSSKRRQHQQQQQQQQQQSQQQRQSARDEKREPMIDKLVKDIRQKVKDSKKFWSNLPFQICNQEDYAASVVGVEGNCWNGNTVDKYPHSIVQDLAANPEFPTKNAGFRQSALVAQQLFALKNAVGNLRNAYNGLDVEWNDIEDAYDGSGSGSGAGDDDEDSDHGGSGLGPYPAPDHIDRGAPAIGGGGGSSTASVVPPNTSSSSSSTTTSTDGYDGVDLDENEVDPRAGGKKSGAAAAARFGGGLSLRQAMLSYLFPIYVAWFGGVLCDLF